MPKDYTKCKDCGSSSLFDTDNEEGYEGEFVTVCNDCGYVNAPKKKKIVKKK